MMAMVALKHQLDFPVMPYFLIGTLSSCLDAELDIVGEQMTWSRIGTKHNQPVALVS